MSVEVLSVDGTSRTLTEMFARVCARHGGRTAVTLGAESMRYDELAEASGRVAAGLAKRNVGRGSLVAIAMERTPAMVVAMLGVVRAGAAYLPIDSRYPEARVREMVEDARPDVMVGLGGVSVGELMSGVVAADVAVGPEDRAYVIYTSGSTGKPKGVEVTHGNVVRLLSSTEPWFGFGERDVWTMFHSFAFDFSVWEMWGCLLTGGRLVIVPFETSRAPEEFRALLVRESVTVLNQTPSAFALLDRVDAAAANLAGLKLRVVIFGGEALTGRMLQGWMGRHGDRAPQLVNMYGITETTVHVTYRRMRVADGDETESLIGEAIPDLRLCLLDENLQPVGDGAEGEICVAGAGVAGGYLRRAELTAERFVGNAFGRMYRSGDMARRREDGELVYLGRRDGQVKINGFRIELGEVEAALGQCEGTLQACVLARPGPDGALRLVAYVVGTVEIGQLSAEMAGKLPGHMLPALYVALASLPLNGNGKIDREALPLETVPRVEMAVGASAMQRLVAGVWKDVLGYDVGGGDNFFDVGGTSLLLISVRTRLQEKLGRAVPVTWMFECTTVRALAVRLEGGSGIAAALPMNGVSQAEKQRQVFARARAQRSTTK